MIGVLGKVALFPSIVNRHLADILLRVDDPLRELPAGSRANLLVSVLSKDPNVELIPHLGFE